MFFDVLCIALSATQTLALAILCADAFHLNEAYSEREEKERKGWSDADVQRERERSAFLDMTDKE